MQERSVPGAGSGEGGERRWEMTLPAQVTCGFCGRRNRWPDGCPGDNDEICVEEIAWRHELGDHRRCSPNDCDGTAVLAEVAARGGDCARQAGKPFAVVNTMVDPWECRPFDRLQQAKPYRSRLGKAAGHKWSIEFKVLVFVVTAEGKVI
jgi:hypothetical protein